jgi:hypothetical protein
MSSTQIEDANRLALSAKTEVRQALLTVNVVGFLEAFESHNHGISKYDI